MFREECETIGRAYDPAMVGVTRGLQIIHRESERRQAIRTRREVLKNIGDLARGPGAERYHNIKEDADAFQIDDAPLLGMPEEIVAQLKRLEAGGVENVLFAAPGASVARCARSLRKSCRLLRRPNGPRAGLSSNRHSRDGSRGHGSCLVER